MSIASFGDIGRPGSSLAFAYAMPKEKAHTEEVVRVQCSAELTDDGWSEAYLGLKGLGNRASESPHPPNPGAFCQKQLKRRYFSLGIALLAPFGLTERLEQLAATHLELCIAKYMGVENEISICYS